MYRSIVLTILLFFNFVLYAQQSHFVYIQTENKQAFYVKVNNKLYSSTASGYIIIPSLPDGAYTFNVGFPKSEFPEQPIYYSVNQNDAGFLLKNFGEKGWGLFNLQTLEVLMAGNMPQQSIVATEVKTDAFSSMLSDVIDDPSIKKTTKIVSVVEKEEDSAEVQPQIVVQDVKTMQEQVIQKDTTKIEKTGVIVAENIEDKKEAVVAPVIENVKAENTLGEYIPSELVRVSSGNTDKGFAMLFIDKSKLYVDTVDVLIPEFTEGLLQDTTSIVIPQASQVDTVKVIATDSVVVAPVVVKKEEQSQKEEPKKESNAQFLDIELANPNQNDSSVALKDTGLVSVKIKESETQNPSPVTDSVQITPAPTISKDCTQATDEDFFKLRKKMAAADAEFDMITIAKKSFKAKCFTVAQIKNLSVLFLNDAGKFRFFQEAINSVSNKADFSELRSQLSEEGYVKEFDTLIAK